MAIAHICLGCGLDLARVRAIRDIHYGLPMVICPSCDSAAVRRRHPFQRSWRSFLRVKKSLCAMLWHTVALLVLLGINLASIGFISKLPELLREYGFGEYRYEIALSLVVVPLVTGTWLAVGLHHLGRWRAFVMWTAIVAVLLSIELAAHVIGVCFKIDYYINTVPMELVSEWFGHLTSLGILMTLALSGIPLGAKVRAFHARHRAHYWRKRMRRMRKRRGGT